MLSALARRAVTYLAELTAARAILWCYLLWYLVIAVRYFDPYPRLWLTSLGLSAIVGFALLLNARAGASSAPLGTWQKARFFMAPFCVSSFAALVKGRGFVLVFSPHLAELAMGLAACATFLLLRQAARHSVRRRSKVAPAPASTSAKTYFIAGAGASSAATERARDRDPSAAAS